MNDKKVMVIRPIGKVMCFCIGSALVVCFLTGCATHSKTYKEEVTVTTVPAESAADSVVTNGTSEQTTTTVKEETTTEKSSSPGIVGGTIHVIGQIIAFPFKLVGWAIGAIF